jgi:hypothetical protein
MAQCIKHDPANLPLCPCTPGCTARVKYGTYAKGHHNRARYYQTGPARFWASLYRSLNGCLLSLRHSFDKDGYVLFQADGSTHRGHRYAYELVHGPAPTGKMLLHRCPGGSNRGCCNPAHICPGTAQDNAADRDREGHTTKGEQVSLAKLTTEQVLLMRELHAIFGMSYVELGRSFGITAEGASAIIRRKVWKHI